MTPYVYVTASIVGALAMLAVFIVLLKRVARRCWGCGLQPINMDSSANVAEHALDLEIGERIFDPNDSEFVALETPAPFAFQFRDERTVLALDWLRRVRTLVNGLIREHRRAARENPDARPAEELRLALEFLFFHATIGILYGITWMQGPTGTRKLLGFSLDLAGRLRGLAEIRPVAAVRTRTRAL